jgi:hypothetical protein
MSQCPRKSAWEAVIKGCSLNHSADKLLHNRCKGIGFDGRGDAVLPLCFCGNPSCSRPSADQLAQQLAPGIWVWRLMSLILPRAT